MATADGCQRAEEMRAVRFQPLDRRLLAESLLPESCQRLLRLRMGYATDRGGCESEMLRRLRIECEMLRRWRIGCEMLRRLLKEL